MSLLPAGKLFSSPGNPLFATQEELAQVVSNLSTINVVSSNSSGITITEPSLNTFNVTTNFSNAGGLSFLTYPGSTAIGLSNAGVTGLVAGSGIGVSGGTGSVTVSNTGVTGLTAGNGVTVSGATGNVTVATPIVPNLVQDQYTTNPISATTPPGGGITTIVNYGGLVPEKLYMFSISCGVGASVTDNNKDMSVVLQFPGIGELFSLISVPANQNGTDVATSAIIRIPAGQTSVNVAVATFNFAGGDTASGTIYNSCIVAMN
jgi:hypothetical protein